MNKINLYRILLAIAAVAIIVLAIRPFVHDKTSGIVITEDIEKPDGSGSWVKIDPQQIVENPITLAANDWFALATGKGENVNAMTISWATIGHLWDKPVLTIYIHPDRYTHDFLESNDYFTATVFSEEHREKLNYLGTHSGRSEDKIKNAGLTLEFTELGNPTFTDGRLMIECRKLYSGPFEEKGFTEDVSKIYPDDNISEYTLYVGEIVNVWIKK